MRAVASLRLLASWAAALTFTVAWAPTAAWAAGPTAREAAVAQANAGIEALTAGHWADAVRELARALPLAEETGDPGLIGGCHRALAKAHDGLEAYDEALVHYRAYLAVGLDEPLKRKEVQDRVAVLAGMREGQVLLSVDAAAPEVTVDAVEVQLTGEPIRLALGRHTVRVTAQGFEPHEEDIVLTAGQTLQLAIRMRPAAGASPTLPPGADPTVPGPSGPSQVHAQAPPPAGATAWPWVTLGLGVAAAGVGAYFYFDGDADWQTVSDAQRDPASMSRARADALVADGDSKHTLGTIVGGVGAALVVTGVILFIRDGGDDGSADDALGVAPVFAPLVGEHTVGFSVGGGF